jgi:hypothetical protein
MSISPYNCMCNAALHSLSLAAHNRRFALWLLGLSTRIDLSHLRLQLWQTGRTTLESRLLFATVHIQLDAPPGPDRSAPPADRFHFCCDHARVS